MTNRYYSLILYGLLALAVLYGGCLRFQHITDREPFVCDEADYVSEALFLYSAFSAALNSVSLYQEERRTGRDVWKKEEQIEAFGDSIKGGAPVLARPGHIFLVALAMAFVENPEAAGSLESAFFGTLSIILVFLLGRALYGPWVGLVAAILLAISPYHIWYSRTAFAEADTTFLLLLTVLVYYLANKRSSTWLKTLTGLVCGIGFIVHHRFVLFLGVLWILEGFVAVTRKDSGHKGQLIQFCLLNVAYTIPILSVEAIYHVALVAFQAAGRVMPCATYFSQLLIVSVFIKYNNLIPYRHFFEWTNFLTYPYLFWYTEGPVFFFFFLGGVFTLFKKRCFEGLIVIILLLGPLVFYSYSNANARFVSIAVPFYCIAAGLFLVGTTKWVVQRGTLRIYTAGVLAGFLILIQAGISLHHTREILDLKVGYRDVFAFIRENSVEEPRVVCSYPHFSKLYLGEEATEPFPFTEEELRTHYEEGFRYLVMVDFLVYFLKRLEAPGLAHLTWAKSAWQSVELAKKIYSDLEPIYEAPCSFCLSPLNVFEINLQFKGSLQFMEQARAAGLGPIRVYDLRDYFLPSHPSETQD